MSIIVNSFFLLYVFPFLRFAAYHQPELSGPEQSRDNLHSLSVSHTPAIVECLWQTLKITGQRTPTLM